MRFGRILRGRLSAGRLVVAVRPAAAFATRIAMAGVAAFLVSCLIEEPVSEGPSTETGNPALAGILRDTLGGPASGAWVRLYRHSPDTFPAVSPVRLDSFRTGADGTYRFDSLAPATVYALEAFDAARRAFAFLPSAEVPAGAGDFLRRDTLVLRRAGSLSGIAVRDSNPRPPGLPDETGEAGILVRVIGLDRATYTDSAGRYALADIPSGTYSLHFMAADGHYLGEVVGPVTVDPGSAVQIPKVVLDWSPFVAPPSPDGLSVTADSAAGVIHLRWNPVFVSNFDHYRILRSDTVSGTAPDTLRTRDTAYADTVGHLPVGRTLRYRVLAVNTLGNVSGIPAPPVQVPVPAARDTTPASLEIAALVLSGGGPAQALVRLYALSPEPNPTGPPPRGLARVDSARAGADGRVRFAGLRAGSYTLVAHGAQGANGAPAGVSDSGAEVSARVGVSARMGGALDTLRLAAPGSLQGRATRGGFWCADLLKQNENIEVHLAGTPWHAVTGYDGRFALSGLPAGEYRMAVSARPLGCFLDDTVAVSVASGRDALLADVPIRPDSAFIPRVAGLRAASAPGGKVLLEWPPVPAEYPDPEGYEVSRRDASLAVTASSGALADTAWIDDVSGLPSGTVVSYVVRVVGRGGARGPAGGDAQGDPVYFTVP